MTNTLNEGGPIKELGIMVDCSRNAVMTVDAIKRLVRLASQMGYTFIGLYTEDTIEVPGEPYFGYQRGRFTAEEIREADDYAHQHGMELRPYIQTLAHLNQITRYAAYTDIIDTDDILLVGAERTEALLDHLLCAVASAYQTKKINIGMDEAHMVGLGKYLDEHGYEDRILIMRRHLDMVMKLCEKYGLEPQMWSDMFFRLAFHGEYYVTDHLTDSESAPELPELDIPEGLELAYWDYYSQDEEHYRQMLKQHRKVARRVAYAGGAWRWSGFTPNNGYSIRANAAALKACREQGVSSVAITCWGDDGTECDLFSILPVLYEAAREAFPDRAVNLPSFRSLTGYDLEEFLRLDLANLGTEKADGHGCPSKCLLYNDPLLGAFDSLVAPDTEERFAEAASALAEVANAGSGRDGGRDFDYLFRAQQALCETLALKAGLGLRLRKAYQAHDREALGEIAEAELPKLQKRLERFYGAFRAQWHTSSKPFGFETQTIRLGGLRQRLEDVQDILRRYLSSEIERIDELECACLPFGYAVDDPRLEYLEYNRYASIATTAIVSW